MAATQIEARDTPRQPLDVLVQHLVTVALGGGFVPEALLAEVRTTAAYAGLSDENWRWCLAFVSQGGSSLAAYPDYHRAVPDEAAFILGDELAIRELVDLPGDLVGRIATGLAIDFFVQGQEAGNVLRRGIPQDQF